MKRELAERYGVDEAYIETLQKRAQNAVDEAVAFAAESPEPPLEELYADLFCKECANVVS